MPLNRLQRFGMGLSDPAALGRYNTQQQNLAQQQQEFAARRQQQQAQLAQQQANQQINIALDLIKRAPQGSKARALAVVALKNAGMNDQDMLTALELGPGPTTKRDTKVVGRDLIDIPQQGPVELLHRSPAGTGQTINVNAGGTGFGSDLVEDELGKIYAAGSQAAEMGPNLQEAYDLLSDPRLNTGSIPAMSTRLQSLAGDLGVDLGAAANKVGIDLGDLATKQDFARVTRRLVLESADAFKGNLNTKEIEILEGSTANPSTSEQANISAIAAARAAHDIASARAKNATFVSTEAEARALLRQRYEGNATEFLQLKTQYEKEMSEAREQTPETQLPAGATYYKTINGKRYYKLPDGNYWEGQ